MFRLVVLSEANVLQAPDLNSCAIRTIDCAECCMYVTSHLKRQA